MKIFSNFSSKWNVNIVAILGAFFWREGAATSDTDWIALQLRVASIDDRVQIMQQNDFQSSNKVYAASLEHGNKNVAIMFRIQV